MRSVGRKRQAKLDKAISALVDARLLGRRLYIANTNNGGAVVIITVVDFRSPEIPLTIARWQTGRKTKERGISYEEADRLIRKHIGFGA